MSVHDEARRAIAIDRPRFRGVLHAWCAVASVPAGVALVATAPTARAAFAAFVFAYGISMMFAISATFHRTDFDDHGWYRFRRLDHVGIYLCIAGGYTPVAMLGLGGWQRVLFLVSGWGGAALGIFVRFLPFRPPHGMMNALFIGLGSISILAAPALWDGVGSHAVLGLLGGGAIYVVGALIVGARWPDPWPRTFGYHEIWHLLVFVAATLHYLIMAFSIVPRG